MKPINYSCDLEKLIGDALTKKEIEFIHESQNNGSNLDFLLTGTDVYIEVKKFHSDRISKQLASKDNVIVLQGRKSVEIFISLL